MAEPSHTSVPIHQYILDRIVSTDRNLLSLNALASLIPAHEESQVAALREGETDTDHDLHEGVVAHAIIGDAVI